MLTGERQPTPEWGPPSTFLHEFVWTPFQQLNTTTQLSLWVQVAYTRGGAALQVVMRVAPDRLLADVYQRFLRGVLARLAMHPSANFVVQAYLAALHGAQQVFLLIPCQTCQ